jgi:plasmid stabilization system protein ParE
MGCKIIFSPQAIADLEEVVRFIAKDDPAAAVRIGNVLIDRVAILENFPCSVRFIPSVRACAS